MARTKISTRAPAAKAAAGSLQPPAPASEAAPAPSDKVEPAPPMVAPRADGSVGSARAKDAPAMTTTPYGRHAFEPMSDLHQKTRRLLRRLDRYGVPASIIEDLRDDLRPEANEVALRALVQARFEGTDRAKILLAIDVAKAAHAGQTQKRKSEADGLDHIPYANHPIQLAKMAILDVPMSAEAVQAALLHDVVEDTTWTLERLSRDFSPAVLDLVADLTKRADETRAAYLERVDGLGGESKLIKCIDRMHNLLRGFSTQDPVYLSRYIDESRNIYVKKFDGEPALSGVAPKVHGLLAALAAYRDALA